MKGRWESNINVWFPFKYSQNWNCAASLFPKQNYNVLSPNSLIYLSEIYIFPCRISLSILRIYKLLTVSHMTVGIGTEAAQLIFREYINRISARCTYNRRLWVKIATLKPLKRIIWRFLHNLSGLAEMHERDDRVLGGAVRAQARVWALGQEPRKIRLIKCNAKCRYLKKFTCKGTLRQVFYLKGWFF